MIRWLVGVSSLPVTGYGVWLLLSRQEPGQVAETSLWLLAGVAVHDLLVAGLALLGGLVVALLPRASRAPAVVALVVVGTLSVVALPVLGGFGEIADNPTHLDRPYVAAWFGVVAGAAVAVVVATAFRSRRKEG